MLGSAEVAAQRYSAEGALKRLAKLIIDLFKLHTFL